jgi:diadenosine tetraphosphatase ApaH/serine/threonine PP2A family protein phosphatase
VRYLVLSDIHANLEALDAVLEAGAATDAVLILGDLVGYGADPNAVIDRVRGIRGATIIRGNHDKVGAGLEGVEGFNPIARSAIEWTASELSADRRDWLAQLPAGPLAIDAGLEICHGAPFDEDVYIFDEPEAYRAFAASRHAVCLFGHTHVPTAFCLDTRLQVLGPLRAPRYDIGLSPKAKYLINCGAVGQPRDGDGRAAFGILDTATATITILRVEYDVAAAQAKIIDAGLPELLAHRLAIGR